MKTWCEDFDEEFVWKNGTYRHEPEYIKAFIQSTLDEQSSKTIDRLYKIRKECESDEEIKNSIYKLIDDLSL